MKEKADLRIGDKGTTNGWTFSTGPVHLKDIHAEFYDSANGQTGIIERGEVQAKVVSPEWITAQLSVSEGSYTSPWWTGADLGPCFQTGRTDGKTSAHRKRSHNP